MSGDLASTSHPQSTKRTPYTPIFYPPSVSSSAAQAEVPEAYLEYLSRKHIALAQIVQESPSSRSGSPVGGENASVSQVKVDALRERVREAFKYANGDPADGKWSLIVQLLRLSSTKRLRWLGATADGEKAESMSGWINAQSEGEWEEWEGKWRQERQLKQKIQSWQQNVNIRGPEPLAPTLQSRRSTVKTKPLHKNRTRTNHSSLALNAASIPDPKKPSALGFPVVKRYSTALTKKAQSSGKFQKTDIGSSKTPSASSDHRASGSDAPAVVGSSATKPQPQTIQDISETSFLPPSFPDQLAVSTPNTKYHQRHKPEPIVHESLSYPDPYDTAELISVATATRNVEKRARSHTPPHAIKKARVEFPVINSDTSLLPNSVAPPQETTASPSIMITPKHAQLPKLTDLLASRKRKSSLEQKHGTPTERSKAPQRLQIKPVSALGIPSQLVSKEPRPEITDPVPVFASDEPVSRVRSQMGDLELRLDQVVDYGMASPTKSLSSLAASDSDEEYVDDGFEPPFTSTQAQDAAASGKATIDFGWTAGYNSQLDIDGKVDLVSKFIEKDLDYGGWLKDPSEGSDGFGNQ